ncbi:MAG: DUF547 domain-containing protein [Ferruginibacter sp.]|nr:DUF547 domain-containing protein [Cytophagales bacterium]
MNTLLSALRRLLPVFLLLPGWGCGEINPTAPGSKPVGHEAWDALLKKHVSAEGSVRYQGFRADRVALQNYLNLLSQNAPNDQTWSRDEQLAYWINAYNAFTIDLILQHYPVKSITELGGSIPFVNTPWDIDFVPVGEKKYTLNDLEQRLIRKKFDEPRIHFALVCAAASCPRLRNEAYVAAQLNRQLDEQTKEFINHPDKNKLTTNAAQLSKIFDWYEGDFTKHGSLVDFLNRYSTVKLRPEAKISHLDYAWALNGQ